MISFRFVGFNNLNKEDQTELKKKFGSANVNRKRKGEKAASSAGDNDDEAPKAKQSKLEENNHSSALEQEVRQKKVRFYLKKFLFKTIFLHRNKVNYSGNIKMH